MAVFERMGQRFTLHPKTEVGYNLLVIEVRAYGGVCGVARRMWSSGVTEICLMRLGRDGVEPKGTDRNNRRAAALMPSFLILPTGSGRE